MNVHVLDQSPSQIWEPAFVEVYTSNDGINFSPEGKSNAFVKDNSGFNSGNYTVTFSPKTVRYVKVIAKNHGIIAEGNRFAGSKAWLLADEIQVN
ncbi:MAG: hypothetical protein ACXWV9_10205 [Flavisolibacter sp.]